MDWNTLYEACITCKKCRLSETRTNVVFGVGRQDAEVVFIGEGPGQNEDLQGEPFVGRAGQFLDMMLAMIDLTRKDIFIANIVKCRPPGNRDPLADEQFACTPWLEQQLAILKPKIIVSLGRISAMYMISSDFKISRDHGKWFDKDGVQMMALFHPAALLRDPRRRPETFVDLKSLQKKIREICTNTYN